MAALPSAAIDAIITKKSGLAMVLQNPPRNPARMSPGNVAANQNPIIMDRMRAGAIFETKANPPGAGWGAPLVARAKCPPSHNALALPAAIHAAAAITRLAHARQRQP